MSNREQEVLQEEYLTLKHLRVLQEMQSNINAINDSLNAEIEKLWAYRKQLINEKELYYEQTNHEKDRGPEQPPKRL